MMVHTGFEKRVLEQDKNGFRRNGVYSYMQQ